MEQTKERPQSAEWWYECYSYLSRHKELSRWPPGRFAGRSLIPLADGTLGPVPGEEDIRDPQMSGYDDPSGRTEIDGDGNGITRDEDDICEIVRYNPAVTDTMLN